MVVLDYGKKIGDGEPEEVRNNEDVISAYLGQPLTAGRKTTWHSFLKHWLAA